MILKAHRICKAFSTPSCSSVEILKGVDLSVEKGESVAIMGKSGEGKSTLLYILGSLERPSSGEVFICGKPLGRSCLNTLRRKHIGFVFQSFHLLEDFSVRDNVDMPARIARKKGLRAEALLEHVGLSHRKKQLAKTLSGGEKQRVAIARALCNDPDLILADEPTGNLDHETSLQISRLLLDSVKKRGKALVVATHSQELANLCDRVLHLCGGHLG